MGQKDIEKQDLYQSVKTLLDCEQGHLHFSQHKLFTLFSIAFQYFLYQSTKMPGHYVIRVEDSYLLTKLTKRAKDKSTRQFLEQLSVPRKLVYGRSTFHLDFFHINSWINTTAIPTGKLHGAIIVLNTSHRPLKEFDEYGDLYLRSLQNIAQKTITIAYQKDYPELQQVHFPFIKSEDEEMRPLQGVHIVDDAQTTLQAN